MSQGSDQQNPQFKRQDSFKADTETKFDFKEAL
jgi:hypothetical protein